MYDLKSLSLYLLLAFGLVLLAFPEYIQQFAPENQYMKKLMNYKQPIAISSIALSFYLYLSENQTFKRKNVLPSSRLSTPQTITTSQTPATTSEIQSTE